MARPSHGRLRIDMNADPRIVEWLSEDPRFDEDTEVRPRPAEVPEEKAVRRPRSPRPVRATRGGAVALVTGGPETRLLELLALAGQRVRKRPLTAMALAMGAGFVIGGALSFRAGRLLLATAARTVARELLKQLL